MAKKNGVDAIFFAAHADDIELACGGTIVKFVNDGRRVGLVDLTRGEMGTRGTPETRLRESLAAARVLGALFRIQLDFGDGNLRAGREEELELISVIRKHRPSVLFVPYPEDRHPDHARAGKLITEASFYAGLAKIETGQAPHRPQAIVYFMQHYVREPTFVVDTTASQKKKMEALRCYKSQFYNPKSKERMTAIAKKSFIDMIEARARHFGAMIGAEFGEGFVTMQPPRVDDVEMAYRGREV
jgi:bacillithiol biosynthesis deacetylase BshB1